MVEETQKIPSKKSVRASSETTPAGSLLNKSLLTNLIAILLILLGSLLEPPYRGPLLSIGLFALSGALTNWLAIHMLFEKIPGFYGSGVIPARFEDFKDGIKDLIMRQFFTSENVARFFNEQPNSSLDLSPVIDSIDLSPSFDALKEAIIESKFGNALTLLGGPAALDPIKAEFISKMRQSISDISSSPDFQKKLQKLLSSSGDHSELLDRVQLIVEKRLTELTPRMVKEIIQQMIRAHLGWLVVWGGVCGGLIGLIASILGH